jgi:hypothetical protein
MIKWLIVAALLARAPRFLGPPVKKPPADAGVDADAGTPPDAGTQEHGAAEPPTPAPTLSSGVAHDAADLCASVTDVAHSAPAAFERVRGKARKDTAKTLVWTAPAKVARADKCRVFEFKDHSPPFYACSMQASGCSDAAKKFDQASRDLAACFSAEPRMSDDGKKRIARFHPHAIPIRLTFAKESCEFMLFIEPLP